MWLPTGMQLQRIFLSLGLAGAPCLSACSNPVCSDDVLQRLEDDCQLTVGPVSSSICADQASGAELDELRRELCELADPDFDSDCLLERSCEELQQGACANEGRNTGQDALRCFQDCSVAAANCSSACGGQLGSFDMCSDCITRCADEDRSCRDACG